MHENPYIRLLLVGATMLLMESGTIVVNDDQNDQLPWKRHLV